MDRRFNINSSTVHPMDTHESSSRSMNLKQKCVSFCGCQTTEEKAITVRRVSQRLTLLAVLVFVVGISMAIAEYVEPIWIGYVLFSVGFLMFTLAVILGMKAKSMRRSHARSRHPREVNTVSGTSVRIDEPPRYNSEWNIKTVSSTSEPLTNNAAGFATQPATIYSTPPPPPAYNEAVQYQN